MKQYSFTITEVSDFIKTTADIEAFFSDIDIFMEKLFDKNISTEMVLNESLSYKGKQFFMNLLTKRQLSLDDKADVEQFLLQLKDFINQIPKVEVILALDPPQRIVDSLLMWFASNLKKSVVLDMKIDPSIIGGIILYYNGFYKDYSFKKILRAQIENFVFPEMPTVHDT